MSSVDSGRSQPSKVADLHIFVVPLDLWLDKYRTAFNNVALESVSAGFVRVLPDITLRNLRGCIEDQLGDDIVPEDFVFLRSVGRCMAVVKENQESLLKASDFLPPIAFSPEIFLLPGLHETHMRPASDANSVVIATQGHTTAGMSSTQPLHFPPISQPYGNPLSQPNYGMAPNNYDNINPQNIQQQGTFERQDTEESSGKLNRDTADRKNVHFSEAQQDGGYNSYNGSEGHRSSGENQDLGLSPRDIEYVKSKNQKNKAKTTGSDSSGSSSNIQTRMVKIVQPEVIQALAIPGADYTSPPTPIPSGRVIASPVPGLRREENNATKNRFKHEGDENEKERRGKKKGKKKRQSRSRSPSVERPPKELEQAQTDLGVMPEDDYVIPSIEDVEERSKFAQFPSPAKSTRSDYAHRASLSLGTGPGHDQGLCNWAANLLNELNDSFDDNPNSKRNSGPLADQGLGGMGNYSDKDKNGRDDEGIDNSQERDDGQGNKPDVTADKKDKTLDQDAKNASKNADAKNAKKTKKAATKKPAKKADDFEQPLKIPKVPVPPPLQMPDIGDAPLVKDTSSAKDRKQKVIEELRGELRRAKNERVDLEKQREQKVRRAKTLQTQTMQKRNQSKNIWKKKFFDEKRKTAPLEEQVNRLRYETEVQHQAMLSFLETKKDREGGAKGGSELDKTPSQKSNQLILLARLQNEVEDLRRKVEETKMMLASEMKLRDAAQNELKQLREDLLDKKINLTLTKSQKSLATLGNPENITA
ncbi:predicted protein [Nematostella vectensis]|uniref:Spermatogenesis-associated protein 1 C-terminal domain-containing protein n=1 Tax=Nematostella vectensis TaxID=45351 RepID=A7RQN1_NEMVE|nr:predicted protein [Nematostella vectensis]|eukprot:XP_001638255.1 predicted protein [Nematostella vectensis]